MALVDPLISVIMGAYNCERFVRKALDSVIAQTYSNWEFIICDDCSTDSTLKILREYEKKDARFKIIRNDVNKKLAASLNHCLSYASGEFVARMDADDECLPDRFIVQLNFLREHSNIDSVGCSVYINDELRRDVVRKYKEIPSKQDVLWGPPFPHPTIMMRKKVLDKLNGYAILERTQRGQDWDLWFRFFADGFTGYNIQRPLYIYHESAEDMKKRSFKTAIMYAKTALYGYKILQVPFFWYILALKPILSVIVPSKIMKIYRKSK